jgi:hypothetical protein
MAVQIRTSRGPYVLRLPTGVRRSQGLTLTLVLERLDGIERITFQCHIDESLVGQAGDDEALLSQLARWLENNFERIREDALKTARAEGRLLVLQFSADNPGPFAGR